MNLLEKQIELIRRAHAFDGSGEIDGMELALEFIGTILRARSGLELEPTEAAILDLEVRIAAKRAAAPVHRIDMYDAGGRLIAMLEWSAARGCYTDDAPIHTAIMALAVLRKNGVDTPISFVAPVYTVAGQPVRVTL